MVGPRNKPILVTGILRSGSSWVGEMIASHPTVISFWEPFNYHTRPKNAPMHCCFQYVTAEQEKQFRKYLRPYVEFRHPWLEEVLDRIHPRRLVGATLRATKAWWRKVTGCRPLLKDPIALFSAEWLARTYNMDVVVLIRHPAAFVSSLKRLGWRFGFDNFTRQPELMNGMLRPFTEELRTYQQTDDTLLEDSILLWRIHHHVIHHYEQHHPNWIFIRHEDLSQRPVEEFGRIFERLGLPMTPDIRHKIETHSSTDNPAEAGHKVVHQWKRDSKANVWNWQQRLSPDEIAAVRAGTADLAPYWYDAASWGDLPLRLSA
jgi:hypothetical protein